MREIKCVRICHFSLTDNIRLDAQLLFNEPRKIFLKCRIVVQVAADAALLIIGDMKRNVSLIYSPMKKTSQIQHPIGKYLISQIILSDNIEN